MVRMLWLRSASRKRCEVILFERVGGEFVLIPAPCCRYGVVPVGIVIEGYTNMSS